MKVQGDLITKCLFFFGPLSVCQNKNLSQECQVCYHFLREKYQGYFLSDFEQTFRDAHRCLIPADVIGEGMV